MARRCWCNRWRSMKRSRVAGTTAEDDRGDDREPCQDDPRGAKLVKDEPPATGDQGLETGFRNESIGRTREPRAWRSLVGGLDFPTTHDGKLTDCSERLRQQQQRRRTSGTGGVVALVSHAIAASVNDQRHPVMHQPIDQGRGQGVVHIE
jgi:hypothetical protein